MMIDQSINQSVMMSVDFFSQTDCEILKHQSEAEFASKLESKTRGREKIVMENERLRKEIKRVSIF